MKQRMHTEGGLKAQALIMSGLEPPEGAEKYMDIEALKKMPYVEAKAGQRIVLKTDLVAACDGWGRLLIDFPFKLKKDAIFTIKHVDIASTPEWDEKIFTPTPCPNYVKSLGGIIVSGRRHVGNLKQFDRGILYRDIYERWIQDVDQSLWAEWGFATKKEHLSVVDDWLYEPDQYQIEMELSPGVVTSVYVPSIYTEIMP